MDENVDKSIKYDIVSLIFHRKIDFDMFVLDNENLKEWRKKQAICRDKINRIVKSKVHPEYQEEIKKLIDNYLEAVCEISFWEGKDYYNTGFNDCFSLFVQHMR